MKNIVLATLMSMSVFAVPAIAADPAFFVGVNAGSAKIDEPGFESTTAYGLLGGYSFNQNFAAEVAYTNFGSKDYVRSSGSLTVKSSAFSVSGVGSYPFNEIFSVFAKVGVASTKFDSFSGVIAGLTGSASNTDLTWGIGGQFNITSQMGVRIGYDLYKIGEGVTSDQKLTSIGVVFKF